MSADLVQTIVAFLAGGFLIFLAITITRDNFGNRLNRVTGAMLGFAGLGPVFMALGTIVRQSTPEAVAIEDSVLYHLHYVWQFFFPILLLFSWIFPHDRLRDFKHPRLRYLIFIPQVAQLLLVLFYEDMSSLLDSLQVDPEAEGFGAIILRPLSDLFAWVSVGFDVVRTYNELVFGAINVAYAAMAAFFLETGRRSLSNPKIIPQVRVVMWAVRLGLLAFILAWVGRFVLPWQFSLVLERYILLFGLVLSGALFAYATIRHQFLDVQLVFRQSFVYTLTSAALVGLYILVVMKSQSMLQPLFGEQAELVSYGFIILVLMLFQPINNWLDEAIRSMFIRTRTDHRNVIERFSRQVISEFDPLRLRAAIEETLKTALLVDRVYFVLFDDEVEEYVLMPSENYVTRVVLDRNDLMLRGINLLDSPTFMRSLNEFREDSKLAELLTERKVHLVLPMKDAKHLLGFVGLTQKAAGYKYSSEDISLLGVLSNQMVTALTNARLYVESIERLRLQEEVNMARQIQLGLLPQKPPTVDCSCIAVYSTPSRTVGGDFYDFIPVDDERLGIVIADASGKGMPAALMIAQIQAILRSEVYNGNDIGTILSNMNRLVLTSSASESYATLFYAELNVKTAELEYSNAGHNYPVLARANGNLELLQEGGPIIGALPDMKYASKKVKLKTDDVLFMFTDGVSEAMDADENEFGEDRIRSMVIELRGQEPEDMMQAILRAVRQHDPTEPPRDDTTIITMKILGNSRSHG